VQEDPATKLATAARIYDYHLGGTHHYPADRLAAEAMRKLFPRLPALTRAHRAFLRRAVRYLVEAGISQYLDVGSGLPTVGNVHEVAGDASYVIYVDIDPVTVAESLQILEGYPRATAVHGDLRAPQAILGHPQVRRLLDFDRPIGLLLVGVLHLVPDNTLAYEAVAELVEALAPGSFLVIAHATSDDPDGEPETSRQRVATPFQPRSHDQVERFFKKLELMDPGVTWLPLWHPELDDQQDFVGNPAHSGGYAAVGRVA
jgi:SAM-dependent methyltransferase